MTTPQSYPLSWPDRWPRTRYRNRSNFKSNYAHGNSHHSMAKVTAELQHQLDLLRARKCVLSTNVELRLDGQPKSNRVSSPDINIAWENSKRARNWN